MPDSKKYRYQIPDDMNHAASKVVALVGHDRDVLEIGCGCGIQSRRMVERFGCRVTGIELDPEAGKDARAYCDPMIVGDIAALDLDAELGARRFDAITFADVLEHLYDPMGVLKKVRPLLKDDGRVIASIPNIAHAAIVWELAHGRFDYRRFGLLDDTHIRFFTRKNVARLFEGAGYHIDYWDRVVKTPQETEFEVVCGSSRDEAFLDWVCESNREAHAYQFIVSARPVEDAERAVNATTLDRDDELQRLQSKLGDAQRRNLSLQSKLSWLERNRFGPFSRLIARVRGMGG